MELYENVTVSALKRTNGSFIEADYLTNCPYFEYYFRIAMLNKYNYELEQKMKEK